MNALGFHKLAMLGRLSLIACVFVAAGNVQAQKLPFGAEGYDELAILPNGKTALTSKGVAKVFDLETGLQRTGFFDGNGPIEVTALSPNGSILITAAKPDLSSPPISSVLRLWDLTDGRQLREIDLPGESFPAGASHVAFDATGRTFFASGLDSWGRWDVEGAFRYVRRYEGVERIDAFDLSPDGRYALLTLLHGHRLDLCDIATGETVRSFQVDSGEKPVLGRFFADGHFVFAGIEAADGLGSLFQFRLWETETGQLAARVETRSWINAAATDAKSQRLAVAASLDAIYVLDAQNLSEPIVLDTDGMVQDVRLNASGTRLLCRCDAYPPSPQGPNYFVCLWDVDAKREMLRIPYDPVGMQGGFAAFLPDGEKAVIGKVPAELVDAEAGNTLRIYGRIPPLDVATP